MMVGQRLRDSQVKFIAERFKGKGWFSARQAVDVLVDEYPCNTSVDGYRVERTGMNVMTSHEISRALRQSGLFEWKLNGRKPSMYRCIGE